MTFKAQSPICVAPGCRSFARRCGHVRLARQVREELKLQGDYLPDGGQISSVGKERVKLVTSEEKDDGLEKKPSDTIRAESDSQEDIFCRRVRRNLLPCRGETDQAEAWARTADWLHLSKQTEKMGIDATELQNTAAVYASAAKRRVVEDLSETFVEPFCRSCGLRREARYRVTAEPALLYSHLPSAPAKEVSAVATCDR